MCVYSESVFNTLYIEIKDRISDLKERIKKMSEKEKKRKILMRH